MKVYLSFCGFYNSELDPSVLVDNVRDCYYDALAYENKFSDNELAAFSDACRDAFNFESFKEQAGKAYCEFYESKIRELDESLSDVNVTFVGIRSPKEYNFCTDVCEAEISEDDMRKIVEYAASIHNGDDESFPEYVEKRLKPCSGFIPFYSNDVNSWGLVHNWKAPQTQILFDFVLNGDELFEDCDCYSLIEECESFAIENDPDPEKWIEEYRKSHK